MRFSLSETRCPFEPALNAPTDWFPYISCQASGRGARCRATKKGMHQGESRRRGAGCLDCDPRIGLAPSRHRAFSIGCTLCRIRRRLRCFGSITGTSPTDRKEGREQDLPASKPGRGVLGLVITKRLGARSVENTVAIYINIYCMFNLHTDYARVNEGREDEFIRSQPLSQPYTVCKLCR